MSQPSTTQNSRQRAVTLTPEALEILKQALDKSWRDSGLTTRLTRQVRAELMGVSVPTADKILANQGVDRSTLTQSFASLGIRWNDNFCSAPLRTAPEAEEPPQPKRPISGLLKALALSGILIAACAVAFVTWNKRTHLDWLSEHDWQLHLATMSYNDGNYAEAEQHLANAMQIAKEHQSGRFVAIAYKIQGEIACARGQLTKGEESYLALLKERQLHNEPVWAPIHEVLATVQIRLKKFKEAEQNLNIAYDSYTKDKVPHGIAEVYRGRGMLNAALGKPYEALEWFAKSTELNAGQDPALDIDIRGERALILLQLGKAEEAHQDLEACLAFWTKKTQLRWMSLIEMRLGLVEAKQGKPQEARARVTRALAGFQKVGDEARVAEAATLLQALDHK